MRCGAGLPRLLVLLGTASICLVHGPVKAQEAPVGSAPSAAPSAAAPQAAAPLAPAPPPPAGWLPPPTAVPPPPGSLEAPRILRLAPELGTAGEPPFSARGFLSIEGEWTDNAQQHKTDREPEFRTRVAPGIAVGVRRPQTTADLVYTPSFYLPDGRATDSSLGHDLTLRGQWKPTAHLSLSLLEDLLRSTDFRDMPDLGARRAGEGDFLTNAASGEIAYSAEHFRAGASYAYNISRDYQTEQNDTMAQVGRLTLALAGPQQTIQGGYTLTDGEYQTAIPYREHQLDVAITRPLSSTLSLNGSGFALLHAENPGQDFVVGQARVGVTAALGSAGTLTVQAGVQAYDPEIGGTDVNPSGLVTLAQRFASLVVTASYEHSLQSRFQEVRSTGPSEVRSASLLVTSTAFRDLILTVGGRWNWEKRKQTTLAGGPEGSTESTWDLEARLRYTLARNLVLGVAYLMTVRTSTTPSNEYFENRIQCSVTYTFTR